ncbi:MAG: PEP-CTERM sorting domain-containing protein [Akkermansiaceae bacterium]
MSLNKSLFIVLSTMLFLNQMEVDGASTMRGTWFWSSASNPYGSANVVGDAAKEAAARSHFVDNGISFVYGSYGNRPVSEEATIAAWNTSLDSLGIASHLLMAENSWIDPANHTSFTDKIQARLLDFNASVASSAKFGSLHLDIEPQALAEWGTASATEKRDYLFQLRDTYEVARDYLDDHGGTDITIAADLPVWFDSSASIGWTDTAERDAWYADVGTHLDSVSLMPFDRDSFSSIVSGVEWEFTNISGADVRVGLEVDIPGTWADNAAFFDMADQLETEYGEAAGIDIQSYANFADATIVPEPSSGSLFIMSAGLLAVRRRK